MRILRIRSQVEERVLPLWLDVRIKVWFPGVFRQLQRNVSMLNEVMSSINPYATNHGLLNPTLTPGHSRDAPTCVQ